MFLAHSVCIIPFKEDITISGSSVLKSKNAQYCEYADEEIKNVKISRRIILNRKIMIISSKQRNHPNLTRNRIYFVNIQMIS